MRVQRGHRGALATLKLYLDHDTLGGINFYSTVHDEVSQEAQALARLFGTHAAAPSARSSASSWSATP